MTARRPRTATGRRLAKALRAEARAAVTGKECCCRFGAAVSGEYPEFGCPDCEVHRGLLHEPPDQRCRRHRTAHREDPTP